jgi:hypothetical protein
LIQLAAADALSGSAGSSGRGVAIVLWAFTFGPRVLATPALASIFVEVIQLAATSARGRNGQRSACPGRAESRHLGGSALAWQRECFAASVASFAAASCCTAAHSPPMRAPLWATERFISSATGTIASVTTANIKYTSK